MKKLASLIVLCYMLVFCGITFADTITVPATFDSIGINPSVTTPAIGPIGTPGPQGPQDGPAIAGVSGPTTTLPTTPVTGWGPGVVGSLSKFSFKGDYSLLNAGVFAGAAYTVSKTTNWNSFGAYAGPSSQLVNGVTTTKLDFLFYANLLQTASYGGFGVGIDIPVFQGGEPIGKSISIGNCALVLGYQF